MKELEDSQVITASTSLPYNLLFNPVELHAGTLTAKQAIVPSFGLVFLFCYVPAVKETLQSKDTDHKLSLKTLQEQKKTKNKTGGYAFDAS